MEAETNVKLEGEFSSRPEGMSHDAGIPEIVTNPL
jgi:hypothetical protein